MSQSAVSGVWVVSVLALALSAATATAHETASPRRLCRDLDGGLHLEVLHPRVIREPSPFTVSVVINNLLGDSDVVVTEIRYSGTSKTARTKRAVRHRLPSKREVYAHCLSVEDRVETAVQHGDKAALETWLPVRARLLGLLQCGRFKDDLVVEPDALPAVGKSLRLDIAVDLVEAGRPRTIRRTVRIPVQQALPAGGPSATRLRYDTRTGRMAVAPRARGAVSTGTGSLQWFAGDQHVHTAYSMDAAFLHGTRENVADYAAAADAAGLDWMVTTDHSNVHFELFGLAWYTPAQFAMSTAQAALYTATHDFLALSGLEMGAGTGFLLGMPSHYLAYPAVWNTTGFIENPCSGYIFNVAFCEDYQSIINRVANAGGIGFIAHPTAGGTLNVPWDFNKPAVGWTGLEIWSNSGGRFGESDAGALELWHDLLREVRRPVAGRLPDRPGIPSRFPVGIGNSDAHTLNRIGATFTYASMAQVTRLDVMSALVDGRAVASNGPLLFGHINGAGIGDVATGVAQGVAMDITLQSTPEFGPVGNYTITVNVNGMPRTLILVPDGPDFSTTIQVDGLDFALPDKFVTIRADSDDGNWHAFTNPIWLELPPCTGDINDDMMVDVIDFIIVWLTLGTCDGCPSDINGDGLVDILDLVLVLQNAGPCAP